jgi:protoporphyrinogen oxidase
MIYKDFVAEAAQKIMAAAIADKTAEGLNNNEELGKYARGSVNAAKALADALDQDWQETPVDGIHRFSEKEEYFDNYVNWTQNR